MWGFHKIRGAVLRVPIIRVIVFGGRFGSTYLSRILTNHPFLAVGKGPQDRCEAMQVLGFYTEISASSVGRFRRIFMGVLRTSSNAHLCLGNGVLLAAYP